MLSQARLSDFPFTFQFHALEKEMATHSSVLVWRIPGTGEPGGLPSLGSHRVGHDWSDLAAAAACIRHSSKCLIQITLFNEVDTTNLHFIEKEMSSEHVRKLWQATQPMSSRARIAMQASLPLKLRFLTTSLSQHLAWDWEVTAGITTGSPIPPTT